MADRLLTTREVAAMLAIDASTVCRMRARGDGPVVIWVTPNTPRYRRADVLGWLDRQASAA